MRYANQPALSGVTAIASREPSGCLEGCLGQSPPASYAATTPSSRTAWVALTGGALAVLSAWAQPGRYSPLAALACAVIAESAPPWPRPATKMTKFLPDPIRSGLIARPKLDRQMICGVLHGGPAPCRSLLAGAAGWARPAIAGRQRVRQLSPRWSEVRVARYIDGP